MAIRLLPFLFFLPVFTLPAATPERTSASGLPQVDLGYSVVQASITVSSLLTVFIEEFLYLKKSKPESLSAKFLQGTDFYSFSNIRYAEAPIGNLRFAASIPPQTVNRTVNDGSQSVICPQAMPEWMILATGRNKFTVDPRTSEDCLFLDIVVPQETFNFKNETNSMPVVVWIFGGGFTHGEKSANVTGLLTEAKKSADTIFVAINYRLGLFVSLSQAQLSFDASTYTRIGLAEWANVSERWHCKCWSP